MSLSSKTSEKFTIEATTAGSPHRVLLRDTIKSDNVSYYVMSYAKAESIGFRRTTQSLPFRAPSGCLGSLRVTWSLPNQPVTYRHEFFILENCPGGHDAVLSRTADVDIDAIQDKSFPVRQGDKSKKEKDNEKKNNSQQDKDIKDSDAKMLKDYQNRNPGSGNTKGGKVKSRHTV